MKLRSDSIRKEEATRKLIEEMLFTTPSVNSPSDSDEFRSALILSFEEAVARGLSPQNAIAVVLNWAADECARLNESSD